MKSPTFSVSCILAVSLTAGASIAFSQGNFWQQTTGPHGGIVSALAVDPSGRIFAGFRYSGLFRSTDNGTTWEELTPTTANAIAINSSEHVFVGGGSGLFRSTDHGDTWSQVSNWDVWSLTINSSDHVFAGRFGAGIFRSTDNGENWNEVNSGLTNTVVPALAVNSTGHIFAGTGDGVFWSTDNGDSWTQLTLSGNHVNALAINSADHVFAGTQWGAGVFRSTDNGANWTPLLWNPSVFALATNSADHVYVGTGNGVYRSLDNGDNWTQVNTALTSAIVRSLTITPGGHVLAGTQGGVFRLSDSGETWVELPIVATYIPAVGVSLDGRVLAGVYGDGVARSIDNGTSWTRVNSGLTQLLVEALAINWNGHIFVGTQWGVFRSTDDGGSWTHTSTGLPGFLFLYSFAFNASGHIFAGGQVYDFEANKYVAAVFRSVDNGHSWTKVSSGLTAYAIRSLAVNSAGHIFAAGPTQTWGGIIFRSIDNGESWTQLYETLSGSIVSLAINSYGHIFAGVISWEGVYRSTDKGSTWERASTGLSNNSVYSLATNSSDHVFAGTYGSGVFRSTDNGESWTQVSTGMGNRFVLSLAVSSDDYAFAGTYGRGVYRSVQSTTNQPPLADAGSDQIAGEGSAVAFDGTVSSDPDGTIVTYTWDFGDGSPTAIGATVTHVYGDNGVFTVTLTVTDNDGLSASDEATVTVQNVGPTVTIDGISCPISDFILPGDAVIFTASFSDPGFLDTHTSQWDLGDGASEPGVLIEEHTAPDATGTITVMHAYANPGTYQVTLSVTDDDDGVGSAAITASVSTPAEAAQSVIDQLEDLVADGVLNQGEGDALIAKLHAAVQQLARENVTAAINQLQAFINQVNALMGAGRLSLGEGEPLIAAAEAIIGSIQNGFGKRGGEEGITQRIPTEYKVFDNYPNPFNPSTTIQYDLPEPNFVTLAVYDMLGREVAVLVQEEKQAGRHVVRLNAEDLASGIYVYRLQAGKFVGVRRVVLLR